MKNILLVFAAGCLGALLQILAMNVANHYGLIHSVGVELSSSYSPQWIYPRIVWGGLWGFIFLLPLLSSSVFLRSFVMCLIPTCAQLFVFYPFYENKGVAGLSLGMLTPFVVLFFYWVWALTAAIALRVAR
jgi:hypothetical protein